MIKPRVFADRPLVMDVILKREEGGQVITAWDRASDGCEVVAQAYMQPDGTFVYERSLKIIK